MRSFTCVGSGPDYFKRLKRISRSLNVYFYLYRNKEDTVFLKPLRVEAREPYFLDELFNFI